MRSTPARITLFAACFFYSSLRLQTQYSRLYYAPEALAAAPELLGDWSAPLDDVFIHFDFARATARGHPFQWSAGNGYSSGGTSLLYPFVLAFWVLDLGRLSRPGSDGVGGDRRVCVGVRAAAREPPRVPRFAALGPATLRRPRCSGWACSIGASSAAWRCALFLGLWGIALIAWDDLLRLRGSSEAGSRLGWASVALGLAGAMLVATRPEAVTTLAVLAAQRSFRRPARAAGRDLLSETLLYAAAARPLFVLVIQQLANRMAHRRRERGGRADQARALSPVPDARRRARTNGGFTSSTR